jgi:hypothetical protein
MSAVFQELIIAFIAMKMAIAVMEIMIWFGSVQVLYFNIITLYLQGSFTKSEQEI